MSPLQGRNCKAATFCCGRGGQVRSTAAISAAGADGGTPLRTPAPDRRQSSGPIAWAAIEPIIERVLVDLLGEHPRCRNALGI